MYLVISQYLFFLGLCKISFFQWPFIMNLHYIFPLFFSLATKFATLTHVRHIPVSTPLISLYDVVGFAAIQPTKRCPRNQKRHGGGYWTEAVIASITTLPWFMCALLQSSTHIAPCPFSPKPMFSIMNTPCQFSQKHKNKWLLKNA